MLCKEVVFRATIDLLQETTVEQDQAVIIVYRFWQIILTIWQYGRCLDSKDRLWIKIILGSIREDADTTSYPRKQIGCAVDGEAEGLDLGQCRWASSVASACHLD